MLRALWNSRSGMIANQEKLDAVSNNISNINTSGYKKVDVSFQDLVYETMNRKGYPVTQNPNRQVDPYSGSGVKTTEWTRNDRQGILVDTGKSTDFAIDGEGYFKVNRPDGSTALTRSGEFSIDALGRLADSNGNLVEIKWSDGKNYTNTQFTSDNFRVDESGQINVVVSGNSQKVGNLQVYVPNQNEIMSAGNSLYVSKNGQDITATTNDISRYSIKQGFTEGSNVAMEEEFADMIVTQRAFELSSRGLKTADEMWGMVNNMRGR